jgi:hypothetical protein
MRPRHDTREGATVAACSPECVDSPSSANARSRADWKREPGCFSRQRAMMRASAGGTCSAGSMSGGSARRIADITSAVVSPVNARRPVSIS